MIKNLYWLSWLIFLVSAGAIIAGGLILLKNAPDCDCGEPPRPYKEEVEE